jgi:hypothetical protein
MYAANLKNLSFLKFIFLNKGIVRPLLFLKKKNWKKFVSLGIGCLEIKKLVTSKFLGTIKPLFRKVENVFFFPFSAIIFRFLVFFYEFNETFI